MADLYMLCGIPGSGKTTWGRTHSSLCDRYVSRDDIRFYLLKDGEDYFAHEDEVLKLFYERINEALEKGYDVFADATHLTVAARKKFLSNISAKYNKLNIIAFDIPICVALERNDNREGRSFVPRSVIRRMWNQFEMPTYKEGFNKIYRVDKDNKIHIIQEG